MCPFCLIWIVPAAGLFFKYRGNIKKVITEMKKMHKEVSSSDNVSKNEK